MVRPTSWAGATAPERNASITVLNSFGRVIDSEIDRQLLHESRHRPERILLDADSSDDDSSLGPGGRDARVEQSRFAHTFDGHVVGSCFCLRGVGNGVRGPECHCSASARLVGIDHRDPFSSAQLGPGDARKPTVPDPTTSTESPGFDRRRSDRVQIRRRRARPGPHGAGRPARGRGNDEAAGTTDQLGEATRDSHRARRGRPTRSARRHRLDKKGTSHTTPPAAPPPAFPRSNPRPRDRLLRLRRRTRAP